MRGFTPSLLIPSPLEDTGHSNPFEDGSPRSVCFACERPIQRRQLVSHLTVAPVLVFAKGPYWKLVTTFLLTLKKIPILSKENIYIYIFSPMLKQFCTSKTKGKSSNHPPPFPFQFHLQKNKVPVRYPVIRYNALKIPTWAKGDTD